MNNYSEIALLYVSLFLCALVMVSALWGAC